MAVMERKTGVSWKFRASPVVAGLARDRVGLMLRAWGVPFLVSDAVLVIGELAANAVKVSGVTDAIKVLVGRGDGEVFLAVWDGCDALPVTRTVEISLETLDLSDEHLDDNGGRGLVIVEALASRCWVAPTPPRGKWVCAVLGTEDGR